MTNDHAAVAAIADLDLTAIKFKLMTDKGWPVAKLERVELLYKRFLTLIALHPSRALVPNDDVDEFWHAHILDTRKYAADMQQCLGYFLHHFPYFGLRSDEDRSEMNRAFAETVQLYEDKFGIGEPRYISSASQISGVVCGNDCGGNNCGNQFEAVDFRKAYDVARMQSVA